MFDIDKTLQPTLAARQRMASGICARLEIHSSLSLSYLIGDGTECTNEAAVATWLANRDIDITPKAFEKACKSLEQTLRDLIDDQ
ncbi:MAG: hypothetical protein KZQ96_23340 [Candidatus Thiodiazotropha sp. (ex Lucinoma borealis)]|nr:hypothetical protein [Candidatus Thiodiazotropha sp. (ex Lucinoma borealis)]